MSWGEEYPIGSLGDIKIYFMHYSSCTEAKETWEKRKARIKWDRIFVIATDKDGFDASCLSLWKTVPYPKILFTVKDWNDKTCVSFPKYQSLACVPDLIPSREFYKDDVLISSLNAYAESFYE